MSKVQEFVNLIILINFNGDFFGGDWGPQTLMNFYKIIYYVAMHMVVGAMDETINKNFNIICSDKYFDKN